MRNKNTRIDCLSVLDFKILHEHSLKSRRDGNLMIRKKKTRQHPEEEIWKLFFFLEILNTENSWHQRTLFPSFDSVQFSQSVMSNSMTPWTEHARLPCPSPSPGENSNMSIESMMPSNHFILCHLLFLLLSMFPNIRVFYKESSSHQVGTVLRVSASASVLPMDIQDRFI